MRTAVKRAPIVFAEAILIISCSSTNSPPHPPPPPLHPFPIERVDLTSSDRGGDGPAEHIRLSANGNFAVFDSLATDLSTSVPTFGVRQVYRKNLATGALTLLSRGWGALGRPAGNADSMQPSISDDGNLVAFTSVADNLVPADTNLVADVFVVDIAAGTIDRISNGIGLSQSDGHSETADISGNGEVVVFASFATNLVIGDNNVTRDVFAFKRVGISAGIIKRLSVDGNGAEKIADSQLPRVNQDGTAVVFQSSAALVDIDHNIFDDVYESIIDWSSPAAPALINRITIGSLLEDPDGNSGAPALSSDGRVIAFISSATNLVSGDTNGLDDIFVFDRDTLTTSLVSLSNRTGAQGDQNASPPSISGDGRFVAFGSFATNLVDNDTNGTWDVFVRDRSLHTTERLSLGADSQENNDESNGAAISRDGSAVGFKGSGTALPDGQIGFFHVYRALNPPSGNG